MGVRRVEELDAFQLSEAFKRAVYRAVATHPAAGRDWKYRDQLFDAASGPPAHISEGFGRRSAREFDLFLSYARGSIAEALTRLRDGVDRGHFTATECADAEALGRRAAAAIAGLQRSLKRFR